MLMQISFLLFKKKILMGADKKKKKAGWFIFSSSPKDAGSMISEKNLKFQEFHLASAHFKLWPRKDTDV